jgi:hypothetical protein
MWLALLFLIVLLWLFAGGSQRASNNSILDRIRKDLDRITDSIQVPTYQLEEGTSSYFTQSRWGGKKIVLYLNSDYTSILFSACHEMAHLLCEEEGHGEKFQIIEKKLISQGRKLGLLKGQISKDYPCA